MIVVIGLLLGIIAGLFFEPAVPNVLEPYLPIAVVAALDATFGALRAYLDGIFDDKVFVVSFVSNVLIAALIVYLGDQLGVGGQLSTGVIVVLGIRIFSHVAAIRRHLCHAGADVEAVVRWGHRVGGSDHRARSAGRRAQDPIARSGRRGGAAGRAGFRGRRPGPRERP